MLEGANIKLSSVISDVMGVSVREMLEAMMEGETDSKKMAEFACGTMKKKKAELDLALQGNMNPHQRLMLKTILDEKIESLD